VDQRVDDLRSLIEKRYPQIGAVREIAKQKSDAIYSNEHYFVETVGGRFFLKQLENADSLYQQNGISRLEWVCRATHEIGASGLPVERIVQTADAGFLVNDRGTVVRLYHAISGRPFGHSDEDTDAAAELAGRFHREALPALAPETIDALRALSVPYPLAQTRSKIDLLHDYVENFEGPPEEESACDYIAQRFSFLRECLELTADIVEEDREGHRPIHSDLHPDNVLYSAGGEASMIDLDNMMFEAPMRCTAFSILRFALLAAPAEPLRRLREVAALWRDGYESGSGEALGNNLKEWMVFLELEKVLRILDRRRSTGKYGHFLPNIETRHLPNLQLLVNLEAL
jgi:Ser/Thr protein kinase RdoA (MazF antagonist)